MTFVYFLGLLVIFLPIGFGAAFLTQLFSQYHNAIYFGGGIFLIFLGLTLVSGKHFSFPSPVHPTLNGHGFGSIFILGIFSGIATTCCAPVLAGVVALSALPGSFIFGGIYTLAYVLGMVTPLFILAALLDKADLTKRLMGWRKFSNLFSGLMFLALGILILYLAQTNQLTPHVGYQLTLNLYLAQLTKFIGQYTAILPEYIWAGGFVLLTFFIIRKAILQIKHEV